MEKVSFFDAIEANKRNSILLIFLMSILFAAVVFAFSFIFDINPFITSFIGFFALLFYGGVTFFAGDKVVLAIAGAKEARKEDHPYLYNVTEGLALASGIPMPRLYVVDDPAPNAFATGRDPKHASVAVTTGLLKILNRQELEGVIAHEISHIANYDIRFMMLAVVFVGAIGLLANIGARTFFWTGGGHRDRKGGNALAIIALVFLILAPIFAMLVRLAISRQREYLADANGARITRYPEGLASALEKITGTGMNTKNATDTTASLYISNPFPRKMGFLLATHPPADERIKKLRAM